MQSWTYLATHMARLNIARYVNLHLQQLLLKWTKTSLTRWVSWWCCCCFFFCKRTGKRQFTDITFQITLWSWLVLGWLDWIFWGDTLSIKNVGMSKDMVKRLPQLYFIKIEISYDLGFIAIGVAMATQWRHYVFIYLCVSLYLDVCQRNRLREYVPSIIATITAKFRQILWKYFETKF